MSRVDPSPTLFGHRQELERHQQALAKLGDWIDTWRDPNAVKERDALI